MARRTSSVLILLAVAGMLAVAFEPLREAFFPATLRDASEWDEASVTSDDEGGPGGSDDESGGPRLLSSERARVDPAEAARREAARLAALAARDAAARDALAVDWGGALLDTAGRPVAGARLVLANATESLTLTSRDDGTFTGRLVPGRYDLLITAPGRGSLYVQDYLVDGVARLDLELQLAPPLTLRVTLERDGRGLEGARANLALTRSRWSGKEGVAGGVTDAGGLVTFGDLSAGTYELRVAVPEGPELVQTYELKQDLEVRAKVPDAVEMSGTVVDARSKEPVAGALLRVVTAGKDAPSFVTSVETQADGSYRFFVPKGSPREIAVSATGYAPWPTQREVGRVLGRLKGLGGGTTPVVLPIELAAGGALGGRITQKDTKAPLGGVTLQFREGRSTTGVAATSDAEGRYSVEQLNPGRYQVSVESPGWFPERPLEVGLPGGRSEPLAYDVELVGAGALSGLVVMGEGAPVKGVRVWLTGGGKVVNSARGAGRPLETFSGASGQWDLTDVPPNLVVTVRAQLGSLEALPVIVNMKQPPAAPIKLALGGTVNLQGRVLDQAEGTPVPNARVSIAPKGPPWGREGRSVTTDAEGSFRTEGLISGDYDLTPRRGDYLATPARTLTLSADDGEERVELALDPGLVFAGLVTDERGRPVAGSVVADGTADGSTSPVRRSQALGSDGRFRLTGFASGVYRLRVSAKGYKAQGLDGLRGGETRLRFSLVALTPPQGS